jgi:hypothetical protein
MKLFRISGDSVKSLQHLLEGSSFALTVTIASRRLNCIPFLAFVVTEDTRENIADRGYWSSKDKGG